MKIIRGLLAVSLLLCGATRPSSVAAAQGRAAEQLDPLRWSALNAIEKEVERARSYGQVRARVVVWTSAADALWDFEPAKARSLLRDAYEQVESAAAPARPSEREALRNVRTTALRGQLRADLLLVAQRHDPALVEELTRGAKAEENKEQALAVHNEPQVFGSSSLQKRNLALLAARLAATEPGKAVDYAVESLGYGVPQEFNEVFRALIAADPGAAHQLFERATAYFGADPSPNLYDAMILSAYLRLIPRPEPDTRLVRAFLDAALARIKRVREQSLQPGAGDEGLRSALFLTLNQLQTFYAVYWPERAGEVGAYAHQLGQEVRPEERAAEELFPTETSRNDVESILARAAGEKDEDDRDALYLQAALSLSRKGEHERALDAAGRARGGQRRDAVLAYVRRALIQSLISRGELYDAAGAARKIESPEERADVTVLIVAAARKKRDVGLAMSVLQETQKLLAGGSGSASQARAYLWLASSYTTIDTSAGFELMAAAIKAANGAKELEDVRSEPRYLQLGGSSRLAVQVGDNKGDFRAGLRLLARSDFGRTIALAESFENELLRGVSVVTAATSVLKAQPPTYTSSK